MARRNFRQAWGILFLMATTIGYTGAQTDGNRLNALLSGYLANDLTFQKAAITAQSASLSLDAAKINNGMSFSISSGTIKIAPSSDGTTVSFEPQAELALPAANDTTISARVPVTIARDDDTALKDASLEISTGIITGAAKQKKIAVMEAERKLQEAQRGAHDAAITAERDFYAALKKLYNYALNVLTKRSDLYDDELSLRKLQAQGYATLSSTYQKADLRVRSDRRDVAEAERLLERETAVFAQKCGADYVKAADGENQYDVALAFLPFDIPAVEILNPDAFPAESYAASERAAWNKYIAQLKREADYKLTLKANAGYTFSNAAAQSDTVDAGLAFSWNGLTAKAGVSFATGSTLFGSGGTAGASAGDPLYTLSLAWNPNAWRLAAIDARQDELDAQLEDIAIQSAANDYATDMADKTTEIADLIWAKESYQEEYAMYERLEKDTEAWYRQGIVTESDWRDARDNRSKAQIHLLINAIDVILCNDETRLLFCEAAQ